MKEIPRVPLNKVRALELRAQLEVEFSKPAWRWAEALAHARWAAGGGRIQKITKRNGHAKGIESVKPEWRKALGL